MNEILGIGVAFVAIGIMIYSIFIEKYDFEREK